MSLDGTYDNANIFAKILRGEASTIRIYEDSEVLAFMDLFPQSTGHVLVISKTSTARNLLDVDAMVLTKLMIVVQRVAKAARAALQPDGLTIVQFNGQAAGQTVFHLHFHVIPIWAGRPLKGHGHGEMADADQLSRLAGKIAAHLEDEPTG